VSLSTAAFDQAQWRTTCQSGTALYEESRVAELDRKRAARKQQAINTTGAAHHGLSSSPIGVPIGDAIHRIRRCTPCVCTDAAGQSAVI